MGEASWKLTSEKTIEFFILSPIFDGFSFDFECDGLIPSLPLLFL